MSKIARKVLALASLLVLIFTVGYLSGSFVTAHHETAEHDDHGDHDHDDHDDHANHDPHDEEADHHDEHEDEHLALTKQAFENLGLTLGTLTLQDYWHSRTMPGEVTPIPGQSVVSVAAPVTGVIESIQVRSGQTVDSPHGMFTIRMTDESLTAAQSKFLAAISRTRILDREIERLAPLSAAGAIAGSQKRKLEYELSELQSAQAVLRQEMRSRGLSDALVAQIAQRGSLANSLSIDAPTGGDPPTLANGFAIQPVSMELGEPHRQFLVGQIDVQVGQSVARGDQLCSLNDYEELFIRGQAFENDLPLLEKIVRNDWGVSAEFGYEHEDGGQVVTRSGLTPLRIDNQVDPETQTFAFFMPIRNETAQVLSDKEGRAYHQWLFKPGQKARLRVPVAKWEDQIVLPLDAVMIEGPLVTVFVEHHEPEPSAAEDSLIHAHPDNHGHDDQPGEHGLADDRDHSEHEAVFIELEPVPVRLLHRDERFAVIANDGQLDATQRICLNSAYQLHQAMKMQAGGGAGHAHHHDH